MMRKKGTHQWTKADFDALNKTCLFCEKPLERKFGNDCQWERPAAFKKRLFCGHKCSSGHHGKQRSERNEQKKLSRLP